MCLKPAKTALFDWTDPWNFLIFIIRFSRSKAAQLTGASFMFSSVVEFGPILPFSSTHFRTVLLISIEMCQEIELCYNTVVLKKKSVKVLEIVL